MINSVECIKLIEAEFPELSEELHNETWDGLLHLQIAVFSRFAQAMIDGCDKGKLDKTYKMAFNFYQNGDNAVNNAINVSFLEHLEFDDGKVKREWAYKAMPTGLRKAFDEMLAYNIKLNSRGLTKH